MDTPFAFVFLNLDIGHQAVTVQLLNSVLYFVVVDGPVLQRALTGAYSVPSPEYETLGHSPFEMYP